MTKTKKVRRGSIWNSSDNPYLQKKKYGDCITEGKLDKDPLNTHTYPFVKIDEAYELFESNRHGVIKVAVE